eukprot:2585646-Pleurochrysis_carterae.AAC.3
MRYKWGHPFATLPSDEGDFTSLEVGHKFCKLICKTGRTQKEENVIYHGVIEDLHLIVSVTEDHTFERAQTQIDIVLVPIELIYNLKEAYTTTGVRERDQMMVMVALAWGMKGGKGERRPTHRHTDKFQETYWLKYEQISQERARELAAKVAGENINEIKGFGGEEEDEYNYREEKELYKEEGLSERRRHQVFKRNRHLYHARRYTGGKGKTGGFWRRKEIRHDYIMNKLEWNGRSEEGESN